MANVGSGAAGKTFIGAGNGASGTFASIGTNSGLTQNGVIVSQGNGAFTATAPGSFGQLLQSHGNLDPVYTSAKYPTTAGVLGNVITSNGTDFVSSPLSGLSQVVIQTFTATGTYTPTAGMKYCIAEIVGGGGGGGGAAAASIVQVSVGSGGGGGGYARKLFTAAQIGASKSVTIGDGGVAGSNTGGAGGQGGTSLLGALIAGGPGSGGSGTAAPSTTVVIRVPSPAGAGTAGDINVDGSVGCSAFGGFLVGPTALIITGSGGDSYFGSGGRSAPFTGTVGAAGADGSSYGSGGGGAVSSNAAGQIGGVGMPGVCIITEFI